MSIDDMQMQLSFMWEELQKYTEVMEVLDMAQSVKAASDVVLTGYEKPANQGAEVKRRRAEYGQKYYDKYAVKIPTATVSKKTVYVVQCGAFSVRKNAEKRASKLRSAGLDAKVVNSGGYWKVRLGEFASPAEAQPTVSKARRVKTKVIVTAVEV